MNLRSKRPRLSPTLFALVGLTFVLPFATVSCSGAETSFTGVQLLTRTVPSGGSVDEGPECAADISDCVEDKGSVLAGAAFVAALLGLVLGIAGKAKGPGWCATGGLLAMLGIAAQAALTLAGVKFHSGYVFALLLFLCATVLHAARTVRRRREGALS
jgi:hypothetical protein